MSLSRHIKSLAAASALAVFASAAHAATYTPDTLFGSADLGDSGDAAELAELASQAGVSVASLSIDTKNESGAFQRDDGGNYFVNVAPDTPGYFILKFGTGITGFDSHYFFQNVAEMTKLVWTDAQTNSLLAGCFYGQEECRLSHVTQTASVAPIPVPAAGFLLVAALGGLALVRRRKTA